MSELGYRIRDHWVMHNVEHNEGVTDSQIEQFENKFNVKLPSDFKEYLTFVNGMRNTWDQNMFSFWPLNCLTPISKQYGYPDKENDKNFICIWDSYSSNDNKISSLEDMSQYYIFADFSVNTWFYAIQLKENISEHNSIILVYDEHQEFITPVGSLLTNSFSEFIGKYLLDGDDLFCI